MFADADGAYTKGCMTKEAAYRAFKRMFVDELIDDPGITLDSIKLARYYRHKQCEGDTISADGFCECYYCGEMHQGKGRVTFTISL